MTSRRSILAAPALAVLAEHRVSAAPATCLRDLFNGRDLSGWVNVNTEKTTWSVREEMIVCTGHPIGVMRSDRQYENFVLHIEWMHMELGGNSGVFVWSDAKPQAQSR